MSAIEGFSMVSLFLRIGRTLAIIPIRPIVTIVVVAATINIFHLTVSIVWASSAASVTSIVVTLTTVVFARRILVPITSGRR